MSTSADTPPEVPAGNADDLRHVIERCRAGSDVDLSDHHPRDTLGWDKEPAKAALAAEQAVLRDLHQRLHAERDAALLVVLQGVDAGGKGGAVRSVLTGMNPTYVRVWAFGVPSEEERRHDFLWRIHDHCPALGEIAVFDRSHYEDVLVVRVRELAPASRWRPRYEHIRNFERMLHDEGTHVVKLFLNVSPERQQERLQDRLDSPDERWKFRLGDLEDRALWHEYQRAFRDAIRETDTDEAPWYVVPGDRKWVRNLAVARLLRAHLERIDPSFPPGDPELDGVVVPGIPDR
jgi:PPK2 family polyphosphate:nucleotide phosphotransferase